MRALSGNDGVMEIDDIWVLEILNNSTRLKILSNLEEPSSVKAVADAMSVPATRLFYHINLLKGQVSSGWWRLTK